MNKIFRKLMCRLGYHRIEHHGGHLLGNRDKKLLDVHFLICKDCHYHIANIFIKDKR